MQVDTFSLTPFEDKVRIVAQNCYYEHATGHVHIMATLGVASGKTYVGTGCIATIPNEYVPPNGAFAAMICKEVSYYGSVTSSGEVRWNGASQATYLTIIADYHI